MASYRQRTGSTWEVVVKRKILGGKGYVTETFATKDLGEAWASRLEALLDVGIVPDEYKEGAERVSLLGHLIRNYQNKNFLPQTDRDLLDSIFKSVGDTPINSIDLAWVERWIQDMKVERNNSPVTIRHYVGALRRCFDWAANQPVAVLLINPIRMLPTRYALYSPEDIKLGTKASTCLDFHGHDREIRFVLRFGKVNKPDNYDQDENKPGSCRGFLPRWLAGFDCRLRRNRIA